MKTVIALLFLLAVYSPVFAAQDRAFVIGHMTTCSGLINNYPADSTNWFYRAQHAVIQYFAYLLFPVKSQSLNMSDRHYLFVNPYKYYAGQSGSEDSEDFIFENRWISPSGKIICEKTVKWAKSSNDKAITVNDRQYVPYVLANYAGIKQMYRENGQERLPDEPGLYHINLYVNGILSGVTFFELKD